MTDDDPLVADYIRNPLVLVRRAPDWEWHEEPASTAYAPPVRPFWTLTPATDPAARSEVLKPDYRPPAEPAWVQELELAIKNCPGHLWQLVLEDCGTACLNCERCPAGIDDLYPDGQELIYFTSDDGSIVLNSGEHNLADEDTPRTIPVTARVDSGYNYWGEYDAEIVIEPRPMVP